MNISDEVDFTSPFLPAPDFPDCIYKQMEKVDSFIKLGKPYLENLEYILIFKNIDGGISIWTNQEIEKLKNMENENNGN